MSQLTAFLSSASETGFAAIGNEPLTVNGGTAVNAVMNDVTNSRQYAEIGMDTDTTLDCVVRLSDWTAAYTEAGLFYVGKLATARGLSFRVDSVEVGASFVTIRLKDITRA
jgi:hypothetical protein